MDFSINTSFLVLSVNSPRLIWPTKSTNHETLLLPAQGGDENAVVPQQ